MAGGIATLKQLRDGDPYELLEVLGAELDHRMSDALQDAGSPYGFIRRGSVFSLVLVPGRKRLYNHAEVAEQDTTLFATLHQALLERGFLIRSEEHTSEIQSLMRISYAVFCLKKKKRKIQTKC